MESTRKHSRKRDAILDCMRSTTCHPTAEWVYQQLKPVFPDLSLGTVYRNLAMFKANGTIQSIGVVGGLERYDAQVYPHAHFICTCCGKVTDLPMDQLDPALLEDAARLANGAITGYQLQFTGLCAVCNETNEPKNT